MKKTNNNAAILGLKTIEANEMRIINGGNRPMTFDSFEALFEEMVKTDPAADKDRWRFLHGYFLSLVDRTIVENSA